MNFIFVSPNFPVRNYLYVEALRRKGVTVLGIGDTPYYDLEPRLRASIQEYYYLPDLSNFDAMCAAVSFFQDKYGKIDYLESNNEWWLQMDARLRERFQINTGFHPADMEHIKAKSAMKEFFARAGAKTMRYLVVSGKEDKEKAEAFVKEVGYPVFVKPNIGVGASDSYSLKDKASFDAFFEKTLPEPYIMEEYIKGTIISFDGVCDEQGNVAFCSAEMFPTAVADIVKDNLDYCYWSNPFALDMQGIDRAEFEAMGRSVVKSFGISKRIFHIEFFRLLEDRPGLAKKGDLVALECNMRAPGGYTPDLMNFANSVSLYDIYADVIAYNENRERMDYPKHYAFAASRRDMYGYVHSKAEILARYGSRIMMYGRYPAHIAEVMGNEFYYGNFESVEEGKEFVSFVQERA